MIETGVTVETYSGYRFGERPRAFSWQGRRYDVLEVERRWRTPQGAGFVVMAVSAAEGSEPAAGADDRSAGRWELTYDEVQDTWHICRANQ